MPTLQEIGQQIRDSRTAAGLTQRELSEVTGVGQSHISEVENDLTTRRLSEAKRLLKHFGYDLRRTYEVVPQDA